ncbi:MAG TPA: hypothetical protein PKH99_13685 [Vicinamibacterales bacterium]|nr:hypothetical protein [Vicinamibacterales bacterium]
MARIVTFLRGSPGLELPMFRRRRAPLARPGWVPRLTWDAGRGGL